MINRHNDDVMGFDVWTAGGAALALEIAAALREGHSCRRLACLNPHSYVEARRNPEFHAALMSVDWLVPDGVGIVYASRLAGGRLRDRITGSDVFQFVQTQLQRTRGTVFFLGSTPDVLRRIAARTSTDFPSVRVVGTYSPPYGPRFDKGDTAEMIEAINRASPDVLWVGMTSPKQDLWLEENHRFLATKFAAGVGAVFDFYAETVTRPRPIAQSLGMEWLVRLSREPRRLWRRTFVSGPIFTADAIAFSARRRYEQYMSWSHR